MNGEKARQPALQLPMQEIEAILEQTRARALSADEYEKLKIVIHTFALLKEELQAKKISIERLKRMLFGASTEKTREVLGEEFSTDRQLPAGEAGDDDDAKQENRADSGVKRKGHGRNGVAAYPGAEKVRVPHPSLHHGDACPECGAGKVYRLKDPGVRVRFRGVAPLQAMVYECARLRCGLCGTVYTAPSPAGVGEEKYDETAPAVVGLLRYGVGLPHNRIQKLQANFGIPLAAGTQWELVEGAARTYNSVYEEHIRQAADGHLVHNDDTTMKVLEMTPEQRAEALGEKAAKERTGVFTSGIVSVGEGHRIALFFTGVRHAGENLTEVLKRRSQGLPPPMQMCDGLDHNLPRALETILCRCIAHGRRHFVEVAANFPAEVRFVLNTLKEVYKIDARARQERLSPEQRLKLHQQESEPLMLSLKEWMDEQFKQRLVEPNSGLGHAIRYMDHNWDGLTRFLHVEGAPLDNNVTERALKKAIQHRKNSLFYKTLNGARVGDTYMTLIHTAELNGINAFDYLVALLRHPKEIAERPGEWMPWNYRATIERFGEGPDPPA
jgi:transposase